MKRYYITTAVICLVMVLAFSFVFDVWGGKNGVDTLKVGFIYENDESTPFTYNFMQAQSALLKEYPDRVSVLTKSNVHGKETEDPLRELVIKGCNIVFINTDSDAVRKVAREYPDVQFCQISVGDDASSGDPKNYHTFGGANYQGRYLSGIAAGMKLRQMIDSGAIASARDAVGYVGAFPTPEIISGYTAFLMGVRSVVPDATMLVKYTGTWNSYGKERASAAELIKAGCAVISQHVDTVGPAVACEEASQSRSVCHVGYNQSMIDVAPNTSLVSTRINWTPYVTGAVEALLEGRNIEDYVEGSLYGYNDMGAGFDKGWVEMLELNESIAVPGTQERITKAIEAFKRGGIDVFRGDYRGVDPNDSSDTCDLSQGYPEGKTCSWTTFHYVLNDIITVLP